MIANPSGLMQNNLEFEDYKVVLQVENGLILNDLSLLHFTFYILVFTLI